LSGVVHLDAVLLHHFSNRLREIGEELGVPSYLIDDALALDLTWLHGKSSVGITAGASTPDSLVDQLVETLQPGNDIEIVTLTAIEENVRFRLPAGLND
jgi:4-hydroxy-3-methylbut-2-enyl diphosphate reductase